MFIKNSIVRLGVSPAKVFSVLNGIDIDIGKQDESQAYCALSFSEAQGSANGAVSIGIIGQVGEWKGHDDFVEALHYLKQSHLPFHGTIFGEGDAGYIEVLKSKIASYDLTKDIRWAGFVKSRAEIFSETDICVVPSRSDDPCPTVAIEAAHFGVPLVVTRQGGLPELVQDGRTGYLVDAGSPKQISEKLKLLILEPELRRRIGTTARDYSSQHLTRERMVREMESIFLIITDKESKRR